MSFGELLEFGSVEQLQRAVSSIEKRLSCPHENQVDLEEMLEALRDELSLRAA